MVFIPSLKVTAAEYLGPDNSYTSNTFPMPLASIYPVGATGANIVSWDYKTTGGMQNWKVGTFIPGSLGPF
jgi:hypothetical protein